MRIGDDVGLRSEGDKAQVWKADAGCGDADALFGEWYCFPNGAMVHEPCRKKRLEIGVLVLPHILFLQVAVDVLEVRPITCSQVVAERDVDCRCHRIPPRA
jgi:hypothetical protein